MEKFQKKFNTTENPIAIGMGIIICYVLVVGVIYSFFLIDKISFWVMIVFICLFSLIYLPRFLILFRLKNGDKIVIEDSYILVNGNRLPNDSISDYRIDKKKPQVIFFINNQMVLYQEAEFLVKTELGVMSFTISGSQKIVLLEEYLTQLIAN